MKFPKLPACTFTPTCTIIRKTKVSTWSDLKKKHQNLDPFTNDIKCERKLDVMDFSYMSKTNI